MPDRIKRLGVCFLIVSTLVVSSCILTLYNYDVNAQVSENTLESVANQTEVSGNIAQIDTGEFPKQIDAVFDLDTSGIIYVINSGSNTVSVIDKITNTVKQTIPVGEDPVYLHVDDPNAVYVANSESNHVSVIDTTTNTVKKDIPVGDSPRDIFGDPNSNVIYVANSEFNYTSVIDTATNTVKQNIPVEEGPADINGDSTDLIYVANSGSDTVSVINTTTNIVEQNIPVEGGPAFIYSDGDPDSDVIYVANSFSESISVINTTTNIVEHEIPIDGYAEDIGGTPGSDVYVVNLDSNYTSVIDTTTNTVKQKIPVGEGPASIHVDHRDTIYVANSGSNTVSVIDKITNTVKQTIPVGEDPKDVYGTLDAIYVANSESGGVSVIDRITNQVVAGVTFDVNPFRGGDIICNDTDSKDLDAPINRFLYVASGSKCIAKASKGFEFSSWVEVLGGNSTRTINATSGSPWTAFLDAFNLKPNDPAAALTVNRFGNFTAYFRALPPPVPPEYWTSLFGIIATALVGSLLIPAAVGWFKTRRQTSRLNSFHKQMDLVLEDDGLDESDISRLNSLNKNISDSYAAGRINNEQYTNLKNEVSIAYDEIFKSRIENREDSLQRIQEDISDAYSKGKITKLHYDLLNEKISKMT